MLTQRLVDSIMCRNWDTYKTLCDKEMTCFEPECRNQLIEGLKFHKFYFDNAAQNVTPPKCELTQVNVTVFKDSGASISYVRTVTDVSQSGQKVSHATRETRVWSLMGKNWKCVHFHRS